MPELPVKNLAGEQVDTIVLSDEVFGVEPNQPLIHQAVQRILSDQRLGTQKAKTRGEVSGSGNKPYRQKGTGRARQGTRTSPLYRGGGVIFAPTPRSYAQRMPKKMRRAATRCALSSRVAEAAVTVVTSLVPEEPKTKAMIRGLENLQAAGKVLLVDERVAEETSRASRNIPQVETKPASTLNIVDVLGHDVLVFTVEGIRQLERLLSDANV
ncbi:MAG TPA: 50S ribosomal protein L4 [Chloroflexota bacterium]|nr:50S ribosomal protein L4 [Chloroflexota bacterium]